MKRILAISLVVVLLFAVNGLAAAPKLTVYSSVEEEVTRNLLAAFTKDTGIETRFVFLSSGPALARLEAEKANPQADIWMGAPSENHVLAKGRGLTAPYKSPSAAALSRKFVDPGDYWHSFYMNPMGVAINTDWAKKNKVAIPKSWKDLLKPQFKNQIQMPTPQSSGTAYNLVASLVLTWGEDKAFDYLKKLNKNIQSYTQSGTAPSQAIAIGQVPVAIQFTPAFLRLMDQGYPLKLVFPKEGVGYEAPAVSLVKGAPDVKEAEKLIDWLLSVKGQNQLSTLKTYFFPVHPKAITGKGLPAFKKIPTIKYDSIWAGKQHDYLVNKWINQVLKSN
jgi:iron(III) transport system substrate-binding protein